MVRHFDIWAAIWIASWLLPIIAAWIATQMANISSPTSLYRNQIRYWLLFLTLVLIGGGLASIRQPGQPAWQESSVLIIILAAVTGTASVTRSQLPDLQLVARQILSRLSGTLIIFGLTWAGLGFMVQVVTNLPTDTSRNLTLILAAAMFAGLFTFIYRLVNDLTRRLFVPSLARQRSAMSDYANAIGNLPEPDQLGRLILHIVQSNLAVDDAWLFITEDGHKGKLILRPLASLDSQLPQTTAFAAESPFVSLLRSQAKPIVHYDIEALADFDQMQPSERETLTGWQRQLYMPLHTGDRLVGIIALAEKHTGGSFERADFDRLQSLSAQIGPLLAQAQHLTSLRQINDYIFQQNQELAHRVQYLSQLSQLYARFIALISPELRRPITAISQKIRQIQEIAAGNGPTSPLIEDLSQQVDHARSPIDHLIEMSNQIQQQDDFHFQTVRLEEVTQQAVRKLQVMTEARRVSVWFDPQVKLPPLLGDAGKLGEAVQHLLHNAIKFNKVGGEIRIEYDVNDSHLSLHVIDSGVGISPERLDTIWTSLGNIYDPYIQGSGLGLALTQFIIAAHGGYVTAESNYGSGSKFSIHLPLLLAEDEAP